MKLLHIRRVLCAMALASLGCGHSEPFSTPTFGTDQPFSPSPPVQLTLNRGPDRRAAWLPDGSAILYSTQLLETRDHDVCLAKLPPFGGRQQSLTCTLSPTGPDLTEALESAAPAADGRLGYVAATSFIGALLPDSQALVVGTLANPIDRRRLTSIPYTIPGGRMHGGLSQLRWLSPSRLLYLGEAVTVLRPCQFCPQDTLRSGLDAVLFDVDGSGGPQTIPGTDFASGVSPGGSEDEVYYTLGGDTRVFRRILSSGEVTVVYDFGAGRIARDVHVIGNRMAVVVGGVVAFTNDPSLGPTQRDAGGELHVVSLQDGSDIAIEGPGIENPGFFRRPQLSPSATELVAEVFPVSIEAHLDGTADTTVGHIADLYLFGQP